MNINQEKQLENRINRLSNPKVASHKSLSSRLTLMLLLVGSVSLLAFQAIRNSQPVLSISSDKMNTIYIGIENPMTVAVEGIENKGVQVTSDEVEIRPNGYGQYIVTATKEGQATIKVVTNSFEKEMLFNVEKVPSTKLEFKHPRRNSHTVLMTLEEFKALKEFKTEFNEQLGFDCEIIEYTLERNNYTDDIEKEVMGKSSIIDENPKVKALINETKKGDVFYLKDTKVICPGDDESRKLSWIRIDIRNY